MKLPKIYEPGLYENDIYSLWERAEAFKADVESQSSSEVVLLAPGETHEIG